MYETNVSKNDFGSTKREVRYNGIQDEVHRNKTAGYHNAGGNFDHGYTKHKHGRNVTTRNYSKDYI